MTFRLSVGDPITSHAQLNDLPVGATVSPARDAAGVPFVFTKQDSGLWRCTEGSSVFPLSADHRAEWFELNGYNLVNSLPTPQGQEGTTMTIVSTEQLEAVPLGTTVTINTPSDATSAWERVPDGLRHLNRDITISLDYFASAVTEARVTAPVVPSTTTAPVEETSGITPPGFDRTGFEEAMHSYLNDNDYDRGSEIEDIMERFGLAARPAGMADVEVTIRGVSVVHGLGVGAEWEVTQTFRAEADDSGCACDNVTDAMVAEWLNSQGVAYDRFEFDVDCS